MRNSKTFEHSKYFALFAPLRFNSLSSNTEAIGYSPPPSVIMGLSRLARNAGRTFLPYHVSREPNAALLPT